MRIFSCVAVVLAGAALLFPCSLRAEAGVTDKEILLGQSAPLSGSFAELGKAYRAGAELYFDHVNLKGGVAGRKLKLIVRDDGYKPDLAVANAKALVAEQRVFALTHFMFTGVVKATLPLAAEAKIPFFAPYTGADELYADTGRYLFLLRASFGDEMSAIVRYATTIGLDRIALVRYDSSAGQALLQDTQERFAAHKRKLTAVGTMELNSARPAGAVAAIAAERPHAVILGVSGADAVAFIRAFELAGPRPVYLARSLVSSHQLVADLGPLSEGVVVTQLVPSPYRRTLPIVKEYRALLAARGGASVPSFVEFEGFIAARVLVEGLRRAGRDLTRERFVAAIESLSEHDVGGFTVSFAANNHVGSRYVELSMISANGRFSQ